MNNNINMRIEEKASVEINESQHGMPELTIVYEFIRTKRQLTIIVNSITILTIDGPLAEYSWGKIMGYNSKDSKILTKDDFIKSASEATGIKPTDIFKRTRKQEIVFARQLAMDGIQNYFADQFTLADVGRMFGTFDHSTVIHAKKVVNGKKPYLGIKRFQWKQNYEKIIANVEIERNKEFLNYIENEN